VSSGASREKHEEKDHALTLCAMLFALCSVAQAQQAGKVAREKEKEGSAVINAILKTEKQISGSIVRPKPIC
jgi:hypothetical protein